MYEKLAGMTGTAATEADEFMDIYGLEVLEVPTNMPLAREDEDDEVYRTAEEKYRAVLGEIERAHQRFQPVLVGTASIEKSELLAGILLKNGYKQIDFEKPEALERLYAAARAGKPSKQFAVLNARFHEQEAYIIAEAGVAKMTFYRHFPSKTDLILAFLQRREELWTHDWLEAEVKLRATSPAAQLLAIFDVFDEWFQRDDFEGCSFINVLLEMGSAHAAGKASVQHLENIRTVVGRLAEEAGLRDPDQFARSWHILMKGSIVSAAEGDTHAAQRAKELARLLIAQHRRLPSIAASDLSRTAEKRTVT